MKSIKIKALVIIGVVALVMACNVGNGKVEQEIRDAFDMGLSSWVVEDESDSAVFEFHHDTLFIKSPAGLTLWYNRKLCLYRLLQVWCSLWYNNCAFLREAHQTGNRRLAW